MQKERLTESRTATWLRQSGRPLPPRPLLKSSPRLPPRRSLCRPWLKPEWPRQRQSPSQLRVAGVAVVAAVVWVAAAAARCWPARPGEHAGVGGGLVRCWLHRTCRRGGSGRAGHAALASTAQLRRDVARRRAVQHGPAGASRVDHRGPVDVHHLLHQPQDAPRGSVRPPVRLRRLLGPDARVPRLPHSRADVDAGTGGVRAREVKSCALLRMDLGRV